MRAVLVLLLSWYPLHDGARWVYDVEARDGDPRSPHVDRWREIVRVSGHIETDQGLVILRERAIEGNANPSAGLIHNRYPYLWRANCLYPLYPELWDSARRTFTPKFSELLREVAPDLCFPLVAGKHWQDNTGSEQWRVEGRGPIARGPRDVPRDAFRLTQRAGGDSNYVWFVEGVGPVAEWSWHNGTYTEFIEKLVR